jgi:hypothetical protein
MRRWCRADSGCADGATSAVRKSGSRRGLARRNRALSGETPARQQLSLGISDHAAGPELVPLLERLHAMSAQLALSVTIGFC